MCICENVCVVTDKHHVHCLLGGFFKDECTFDILFFVVQLFMVGKCIEQQLHLIGDLNQSSVTVVSICLAVRYTTKC